METGKSPIKLLDDLTKCVFSSKQVEKCNKCMLPFSNLELKLNNF